jgi:nucleotide-binding universal stress UspA family protein
MAIVREFRRPQSSEAALHLGTSPLEIRRILIATDFSEPAHRALEAAVAIAGVYNSEITVAHATSSIAFAAGEGVVPDLLVDQALEDEEQMEKLVNDLPDMARLHVETVIDDATRVAMINGLVKTRNPDLLVLGSHGPGALERLALGSVAESVARAVAVPVLIFGPHAHSDREPFQSIVLATDMATTGLRPAQYASSLAERFHSRLLVLHVIEDKPAASPVRSEVERRLREDMQSLLPGDAASMCHPEFSIEYGQPAERIVEAARSIHATLVVMGSRCGVGLEDHLPWMTLSQVVREAGCGVLVVRNRFL